MNKIAHKLYDATQGFNQYEDIKKLLLTESYNFTMTPKPTKSGNETTYKFEDGSSFILCDRGYEKVVQLSLFS